MEGGAAEEGEGFTRIYESSYRWEGVARAPQSEAAFNVLVGGGGGGVCVCVKANDCVFEFVI